MIFLLISAAEATKQSPLNPYVALLLGAVAGIITAGAGAYATIRKLRTDLGHVEADTDTLKADAAHTIVNAARTLIEPLRERVEELEGRVDTLESHIELLEKQLREAGVKPPARPA